MPKIPKRYEIKRLDIWAHAFQKSNGKTPKSLIIKGDINKDDIRFIAKHKEHQHLKSIDLNHTNLREPRIRPIWRMLQSDQKSNYPKRWNHRKNAFRDCKELEGLFCLPKVTSMAEAFDGCINLNPLPYPRMLGGLETTPNNCPKLKNNKSEKGNTEFYEKRWTSVYWNGK